VHVSTWRAAPNALLRAFFAPPHIPESLVPPLAARRRRRWWHPGVTGVPGKGPPCWLARSPAASGRHPPPADTPCPPGPNLHSLQAFLCRHGAGRVLQLVERPGQGRTAIHPGPVLLLRGEHCAVRGAWMGHCRGACPNQGAPWPKSSIQHTPMHSSCRHAPLVTALHSPGWAGAGGGTGAAVPTTLSAMRVSPSMSWHNTPLFACPCHACMETSVHTHPTRVSVTLPPLTPATRSTGALKPWPRAFDASAVLPDPAPPCHAHALALGIWGPLHSADLCAGVPGLPLWRHQPHV
jgi:hypothetical protein